MFDVDSFLATISAILLFLLVTCMCFTVQFAERKHKYHKAITTLDNNSNSTSCTLKSIPIIRFILNIYLLLVGSNSSMLNYNDYMVSSTTLQSHIPPIQEILDIDENQDDDDKEKLSLNG